MAVFGILENVEDVIEADVLSNHHLKIVAGCFPKLTKLSRFIIKQAQIPVTVFLIVCKCQENNSASAVIDLILVQFYHTQRLIRCVWAEFRLNLR